MSAKTEMKIHIKDIGSNVRNQTRIHFLIRENTIQAKRTLKSNYKNLCEQSNFQLLYISLVGPFWRL